MAPCYFWGVHEWALPTVIQEVTNNEGTLLPMLICQNSPAASAPAIGEDERTESMIRPCIDADCEAIYEIINDAAQAYCGVIPADRWHEPYMSMGELRHKIDSGVRFWGWEEDGRLLGVMGSRTYRT